MALLRFTAYNDRTKLRSFTTQEVIVTTQTDEDQEQTESVSTGEGIAIAGIWLAYGAVLLKLLDMADRIKPPYFWAFIFIGLFVAIWMTRMLAGRPSIVAPVLKAIHDTLKNPSG